MLEGIAAYQRWAADFKKPEKKREAGDAYCWGIYSQTHATAGPFLREIASRYPKAATHLTAAATYFEDESRMLGSGGSLLHWGSPEGPDAARNTAAAGLLEACAGLYANGIAELEKALPLMEQ
jgi:hypothetical protein